MYLLRLKGYALCVHTHPCAGVVGGGALDSRAQPDLCLIGPHLFHHRNKSRVFSQHITVLLHCHGQPGLTRETADLQNHWEIARPVAIRQFDVDLNDPHH
jgi:hypothetical protein